MRGPLDREWNRCVIVASGPSLSIDKQRQVDAINAAQKRGWRVLVTNMTFADFPYADVVFGADRTFWNRRQARIAAEFHGERWTGDSNAAKLYNLKYVRTRWHVDRRTGLKGGLCTDGKIMWHNGNTGAHTVHLAWMFGMRRGVLVGFDMQLTGGEIHHHGPHTDRMGNPTAEGIAGWAKRFCVLARDLRENGTDLVNASVATALTCVPRVPLETALA